MLTFCRWKCFLKQWSPTRFYLLCSWHREPIKCKTWECWRCKVCARFIWCNLKKRKKNRRNLLFFFKELKCLESGKIWRKWLILSPISDEHFLFETRRAVENNWSYCDEQHIFWCFNHINWFDVTSFNNPCFHFLLLSFWNILVAHFALSYILAIFWQWETNKRNKAFFPMLLLLLSRVRALDLRLPSHDAMHLCDRELTNSKKNKNLTPQWNTHVPFLHILLHIIEITHFDLDFR